MFQATSQLPRDVQTTRSPVPFSVMTPVTTVNTEVAEVTVANTTGATITLTVQDTQATPRPILYQINIDPNSPVSIQFNPPELAVGGVQWQASATGLVGTITGRRLTGWTLDAGSIFCNNVTA